MPDTTISNNMMASINQNTNLTRTEEALLSPDEKVIAARRRRLRKFRIMTPKTTREHIISLQGNITGLKRDVSNKNKII